MGPIAEQTPGPRSELTRLYYAGAWVQAEQLCEKILADDPRDVVVLVMWGEIALARGDLAEARNRLRRAWRSRFPSFDPLTRLIQLLVRAGDWEFLEQRRVGLFVRSSRNPVGVGDLLALAHIDEGLGRIDDAISGYERLRAMLPGDAAMETFRAILVLRKTWGRPLAAPPEKRQSPSARGRVAMLDLGRMGRFGNQLLQYAYLRVYGQVHGLRLEVPSWVGRWLFDLDDPYPGSPLPPVAEKPGAMGDLLAERAPPVLANRDVRGHFQCHTSHLRPHRALVRALFQPGARLRPSVEPALERLRGYGRTLVAIHLRRGDYAGGEFFWAAPVSWYLDWLERIWRELEAPVLYIASDGPHATGFASFAPVAASELGEPIPGAEMYPDFHILSQADLLAVSNSTFSIAAAMLNERARSCVRPDPRQGRLVPFDPWDTDVLWSARGAGTSG